MCTNENNDKSKTNLILPSTPVTVFLVAEKLSEILKFSDVQ